MNDNCIYVLSISIVQKLFSTINTFSKEFPFRTFALKRYFKFCQNLPALSALAIPPRNILMNHSREYWYMGSMLARSATQKKRIWVLTATGMYRLRVTSISLSVCSAITTLACKIEEIKNKWINIRGREFSNGWKNKNTKMFASLLCQQLVYKVEITQKIKKSWIH